MIGILILFIHRNCCTTTEWRHECNSHDEICGLFVIVLTFASHQVGQPRERRVSWPISGTHLAPACVYVRALLSRPRELSRLWSGWKTKTKQKRQDKPEIWTRSCALCALVLWALNRSAWWTWMFPHRRVQLFSFLYRDYNILDVFHQLGAIWAKTQQLLPWYFPSHVMDWWGN
jgi:hypothetical protein